MTVRAIKKIQRYLYHDLFLPIPQIIIDNYNVDSHGIPNGCCKKSFLCLFLRHFGEDKSLIRLINEWGSLTHHFEGYNLEHNAASIGKHPLAQKYGFSEGDYLEILYNSIESQTTEERGFFNRKLYVQTNRELIFPERTIDCLDFNPDEMPVSK